MLLALSVAALLALPVPASANPPAHIEALKALTFEVHAAAGSFSTTGGETFKCTTTTGSGKLETTTTGSFSLIFHGCGVETIFGRVNCTTHTPAQPTGTIATTELKFHLLSGATATARPFILVTPNEATKTLAHFTCGGIYKTWEGTGLIGTINAPACDTSSTKATLDFNATAHGIKEHTSLTGVNYTSLWSGTTIALDSTPTITFKESGFLNCTP
jgi:hypothetical protein